MLCVDHDPDKFRLDQSSSSVGPQLARSAPATPTHNVHGSADVSYRPGAQRGFFQGLLGCLRPVWTIIGKAAAADLKQHGRTD